MVNQVMVATVKRFEVMTST